ncbi:dTDP-4-dehydrorhamnose reductase [Pseudomonas knackmussii B13]|uniref:dTDP-4-dehydrorhamnose reductase n=1 Tax=Pseudomonas knackmussii (strain DSM 6978 / CCUG 54928 / LMG 23759 / B13) TaxID=1301098 RepID=A0A024HQ66_PSEKB|nr:dTDP-4-dehydrorhamnose reductase [Pseudomonas knackmussii]CDF86809.1 dTDP-4-dehydrorhamnose reductase [Pseudomonas knackmussii B13]
MSGILLLGAEGQVGWELQRALAPLAELTICNRASGDLENLDALRALVREHRPDIIVNAAAYTAVDRAESDEQCARRINAEAVAVLAEEAKALNAWLVHYSTDYVFDGSGERAFREEDVTGPLSVYGQTKREGEEAILRSGCLHLIFRTSWVFAARGANFAKTMLRLASERDELRVIADQFGAPTSAELIADTTAQILGQVLCGQVTGNASGLYHLVAAGEASWHDYASFVIEEALRLGMTLKCPSDRVHPITTADYPLPARRPANSRLDTTKLRCTFGLTLPHWQFHVRRLLAELSQGKTP